MFQISYLYNILIVIFFLVQTIESKTFENQIIGKPFVSCLPNAVSLVAQVEDYFEGMIYVKGKRLNNECSREYKLEQNETQITLEIPMEKLVSCGFNIWPKPNSKTVLISGQIVVAFHPELVTPTDRAFSAHCELDNFQQQNDLNFEETLNSPQQLYGIFKAPTVDMSIIPAGEMSLRKENVEMEDDALNIGDPIVLKWKIEENEGIFGIHLAECSAETKTGKGMRIIENGCSLDDELISDATHTNDHQAIFANSMVFKFPEESVVFIRCAVQICVRNMEHLDTFGSEQDLCEELEENNDCDRNARNRRELSAVQGNKNNTETKANMIFISRKFRIGGDRKFEMLKSNQESTTFCLSEPVYYIGISSFAFLYFLTFSTSLFFKLKN